jgi:hypothetical protein
VHEHLVAQFVAAKTQRFWPPTDLAPSAPLIEALKAHAPARLKVQVVVTRTQKRRFEAQGDTEVIDQVRCPGKWLFRSPASCAQGARKLDHDALSYALGMGGHSLVDTRFDVRNDAGGKDPDSHSKTLRRYHQLLWSKPLPGGDVLDLDTKLHHKSELGDFWLSSDSITPTYSAWGRPARLVGVIRQVSPTEMKAFYDLACTVGAYLVFPLPVQVDGGWKQSINQRRGMDGRIRDRFDLTLECIRRHYSGGTSPLADNLVRYGAFFDLFGDFRGYVDHFLLNDLVAVDYSSVKFLKAFDYFAGDPLPAANVAEYQQYMIRSMDFISARNARIAQFASSELHDQT